MRIIGWALAATCSATTAAATEPLVLNDATVEQLASLDGVDLGLAQRVVDLRSSRGQLSNHEALRVLPGMSDTALDSLRSHTTIEYDLPVGGSRSYGSPDDVLREFASEPTIQQVQAWAADYARVNASTVERWLRASGGFAALPEFRVEYRFKGNSGNDWKYFPADGIIDTPGESVFNTLNAANRDREDRVAVRATWNLDKLVMSSERIRMINEAQDVVKLRDKVLTEVTRLYFDRRRAQVEGVLSPKRDLGAQVKDQLSILEKTAQIDALTGGAFSGSNGLVQ